MSLIIGLLLGVPLGALGSLTGIGGGFLLMPALLWLYPDQPAGALSLISLSVVFFNALSGTVLSARRDRVRFRPGVAYALLSLPLVWVGIQAQAGVDRATFEAAFGVFLVAGAGILVLRTPGSTPGIVGPGRWALGGVLAVTIGFVSGFFGVGGGFLFVPLLAYVLGYPMGMATATSQFIVGAGALFALAAGALSHPLPVDPLLLSGLIAGVLVGSPWGTDAAARWKPVHVVRLLAALLAVVGVRFLVL